MKRIYIFAILFAAIAISFSSCIVVNKRPQPKNNGHVWHKRYEHRRYEHRGEHGRYGHDNGRKNGHYKHKHKHGNNQH